MSIYEKLLDLQENPPELLKDAENPHFKNTYISLGAVLKAVLPELNNRGLVLTQPMTSVVYGGGIEPAITTRLTEAETGECIEYTVPLVLDKQGPQAVGSAITYFRRYGLLTLLGFNADEDDDGERASSDSNTTSGQRGRKRPSQSF